MSTVVCTTDSLAAGEPLIGSVSQHSAWLCLEQVGPWGRKALTESRLDVGIGAQLDKRAAKAGVRPNLIRRPGPQPGAGTRPWLLLAHTAPEDPWLLQRQLDDPAEVLDLDLDALARGDRAAFPGFTEVDHELLFVCTNGKRDTCCARLGRPVAAGAGVAHPERVWEITHTGGHRFAPTAILLPSGHLHGRVLDGSGLLDLADRDELPLVTWRGRTSWPADGQAAEAAVRRDHGITGLNDLSVAADGESWLVSHRDGRSWQVVVTRTERGARAESCGKDPAPIVHRMTHYAD